MARTWSSKTYSNKTYSSKTFSTRYYDGWDPDALALIARMDAAGASPNAARKVLINDFFSGVKSDNGIQPSTSISTLFDCLYFTAAHAQAAARLNWIKNSHNLTEVNAPSWTLDRGYTSNGSTSYLSTNYNPSTDAVSFAQNNASIGAYSRTNANGGWDIGHASTRFGGVISRGADLFFGLCNVDGSFSASIASTDSRGLFSSRRISSTAYSAFKNGIQQYSETKTSMTLFNGTIYMLCTNAGTPANFTTRETCFGFIGKGDVSQLRLYNRVQTFLTGLGAAV